MTNASKAVRGALLTARRVTRADGGATASDAFKRWFANSVAHDNGVPRRYFHGTSKDKDFDKFNVSRHGAWFTTDPKDASQYASENDSMGLQQIPGTFDYKKVNHAARVIPAYLRLENPYTGEKPKEIQQAANYKRAQSDWFDQLRRAGHDSWLPASMNGSLAVALSHPGQIKSAITNTGAYGPQEGRIGRDVGGQVQPEEAPGVDVYHGSPHYFDKFDMSKIGTGEGNQAFGRGLYFAQDEGIAKGYRDRLSRDRDPRIDLGTGRGPQTVDDITHADNLHQDHMFTLMDFIDAGGDWDALHKKIENDFYPKHVPKFQQHVAEMRAKYPAAKLHTPGAMYQVRLNADPEHFLHWDRPISQQHPELKQRVTKLLHGDVPDRVEQLPNGRWVVKGQEGRVIGDPKGWDEGTAKVYLDAAKGTTEAPYGGMAQMTGKHLHETLVKEAPYDPNIKSSRTRNAMAQAHAMERLKAAGIPGIRYLDSNSRSGKKDAHNFVVFDDAIPEIKRRYERGGGV